MGKADLELTKSQESGFRLKLFFAEGWTWIFRGVFKKTKKNPIIQAYSCLFLDWDSMQTLQVGGCCKE